MPPTMDRVTAVALFARIVESGSFSKAASEFGITQPTATKAVAAMEARLGARLLHRTTRGVSPTEVGALYYDKCKTIASEIEAADNLASLMQSGVAGTLRISTSVAFGRRARGIGHRHPALLRGARIGGRWRGQTAAGALHPAHAGDPRRVPLAEAGAGQGEFVHRVSAGGAGGRVVGAGGVSVTLGERHPHTRASGLTLKTEHLGGFNIIQ